VEDQRTSVERLIARSIDEAGKPLSSRAREGRRSIEDYLKAGARPRWMERVMQVDRGIAAQRRRLERAHEELRAEHGADADGFARRWTAYARAYDFGDLNELIHQHNEWYPIERDLPMNPRTGDYVTISGRSHRRPLLDANWILERFPA
jgi:acetylornithine deacetylase/succinyl-diaminopimelate desuccinylase-like protein